MTKSGYSRYSQHFFARLAAIFLVLVCFLSSTLAPGAAEEKTYKKALPGYKFKFPEDHFSHDQYKTEWWYYTGHLVTKDNQRFGYEVTFFRIGANQEPANKNSAWKLDNYYLAHFAITDEKFKNFHYYEKLNRAGFNLAGARNDAFYVYNEGWSVKKLGDHFVLEADAPDYSIHLLLDALKPPAVHGMDGVSKKGSCSGCASHYYSMTRLKTEGQLYIGSKEFDVNGITWMDHEFGSNQLSPDECGWDWYSLQLDDNRELMLYVLRRNDGGIDPSSSGTLIDEEGHTTHVKLDQFKTTASGSWHSAKSGGTYPMGWHVSVPSANIDVTLTPDGDDQELMTLHSTGITYWEGSVSISGQSNGKPVTGQGYVEMTGYAEKMNKNI